jgi:acyl carrier protein
MLEAEIEKQLAEIWSEILSVPIESLSRESDFFVLGGDSLNAIKVTNKLEGRLNKTVALKTLFQYPRLQDLANYLKSESEASHHEEPLPLLVIDESKRYEAFNLTPVQQAYWLGRQGIFELGEVATHVCLEVDILSLDVARFKLALNKVINRHDIL